MVFLSTIRGLVFGKPWARSVFSFGGSRPLSYQIIVQEVIMGTCLTAPLSCVIAALTMRIAMQGLPFGRNKHKVWAIRSDIWTTIVITFVGDLFLELLLPSLQCLPVQHPFLGPSLFGESLMDGSTNTDTSLTYLQWLIQAWGFQCPEMSSATALTTDAIGTLLTIRLIFLCIGVYFGEVFVPIAITGGIASGKSTVVQLLLRNNKDSSSSVRTPTERSKRKSSSSTGKPRKTKRSSNTPSHSSYSDSITDGNDQEDGNEEEEGTFTVIDTDRIAHEILLPPSILAGHDDGLEAPTEETVDKKSGSSNRRFRKGIATSSATSHSGNSAASITEFRRHQRQDWSSSTTKTTSYSVHPSDSVYSNIVDTFGDPDQNYRNILDENGLIDRTKLGALVFPDRSLRSKLNRITHPRILWILLKELLKGTVFCSPFQSSSTDVVCADIPLLYESGMLRHLFCLIIVVDCPRQVQFERLRKRNPELTEQQCWDRINSQMPLEKKSRMADIVVSNDTNDLEALSTEVERVRRDVMGRMYGIGMSLLQMLLLVGGSLSLAVSSKLFS